jgi:hypothetical protein
MVTTLGSIRVVVQTSRQEGRCRQTNRERKGANADRRTGEKWRGRYGKRVKMQTCRCRYKNRGKCREGEAELEACKMEF